jgi:hypothetical protein
VRALVEGATKAPSHWNVVLALRVLSDLASDSIQQGVTYWVHNPGVVKHITEVTSRDSGLGDFALRELIDFIVSQPDDDSLFHRVATALPMLSYSSEATAGATTLFRALSSRWLATSRTTLATFEALLADRADDEPTFQRYLEEHPQILDPMAHRVWSRPFIHGAKEPDFVIQRTDDSYVVVEIECPAKGLVTTGNQLHSEASHAVSQALDYRQFLNDRAGTIRQVFANYSDPECLVIIGREDSLNGDQLRALARENASRSRFRIAGFDWLLKRATAVSRNVVNQKVEVARVRVT